MSGEIKQNEIEIEYEDQLKINTFSTINRRKNENLQLLKKLEEELQKLKDCSEELEVTLEDEVDINFAECFIRLPLEEAQQHIEGKITEVENQIKSVSEKKQSQTQRLIELKQELYKKFGQSIQLEE